MYRTRSAIPSCCSDQSPKSHEFAAVKIRWNKYPIAPGFPVFWESPSVDPTSAKLVSFRQRNDSSQASKKLEQLGPEFGIRPHSVEDPSETSSQIWPKTTLMGPLITPSTETPEHPSHSSDCLLIVISPVNLPKVLSLGPFIHKILN